MITSFRRIADCIVMLPHDESPEWKNNIANREMRYAISTNSGPLRAYGSIPETKAKAK
ncbi:MAG TPA: hypothetical protein VI461_03015 [Chitinophagaceae bacterium]|nr:hypothetical protein [Chitinophagaceae bacterium]